MFVSVLCYFLSKFFCLWPAGHLWLSGQPIANDAYRPPSVKKEDTLPSVVWLSRLQGKWDKDRSPIKRQNQTLIIAQLNFARTHCHHFPLKNHDKREHANYLYILWSIHVPTTSIAIMEIPNFIGKCLCWCNSTSSLQVISNQLREIRQGIYRYKILFWYKFAITQRSMFIIYQSLKFHSHSSFGKRLTSNEMANTTLNIASILIISSTSSSVGRRKLRSQEVGGVSLQKHIMDVRWPRGTDSAADSCLISA